MVGESGQRGENKKRMELIRNIGRERYLWIGLVLLLVSSVLGGCHWHAGFDLLSAGSGDSRYGKYQQQFDAKKQEFLSHYSHDSEMHPAAEFLVDNLPLTDAVAMSVADLREHIDYAFLARRTMPWGKDIPWDIFLHYVVPHRTSQEPVQAWRKQFFEELVPLAAEGKSMREAALELNNWCYLKAAYIRSRPWDQGPMSTIRRGGGRCEEKGILLIAAARAIGIPARYVTTPRWQFINDNHAWVEVWIDGGWHYMGAADPGYDLDVSGASNKLKRAVLIQASAFGQFEEPGESIYRLGDNFSIFNVTKSYVDVGQLEIAVIGDDGEPATDLDVYVSLYNYGTFRPIARLVTDDQGMADIELGRSTVLVTVAGGKGRDFSFVFVNPGSSSKVVLDLSRKQLPEGDFWMRFGSEPAATVTEEIRQRKKEFSKKLKILRKKREEENESRLEGMAQFLGLDAKQQEWKKDTFVKTMLSAGGNTELVKALQSIPADHVEILKRYISRMDSKDLLEVESFAIVETVQSAIAAREHWREQGYAYDDDLFYNYVLPGRVYYEPYGEWTSVLKRSFPDMPREEVMETVQYVNDYVASLEKGERGIWGPLLTPEQVVVAGTVASEVERAVLAAAILRTFGIPARYLKDWGWLEFYDGKEWKPFYPNKPDLLGVANASSLAALVNSESVEIEIQFLEQEKPLSEKEFGYFRNFTLSRFDDKGFYAELRPEGDFDEERSVYSLKVPPGEYFFIFGKRNDIGEPHVRIVPVSCTEGEALSFTVDLDELVEE